MMVETFMAQSFVLNIKRQTSNVKHQTLNIKDKENMSDNKKLYKIFLFFIENLRILLYNKQVYSCIIHL